MDELCGSDGDVCDGKQKRRRLETTGRGIMVLAVGLSSFCGIYSTCDVNPIAINSNNRDNDRVAVEVENGLQGSAP